MSALLSKADIDRNELVAALPQLICEHAYLRMTKRAVAQLLARVFRNRPLRSFAKIARSAIDSKNEIVS